MSSERARVARPADEERGASARRAQRAAGPRIGSATFMAFDGLLAASARAGATAAARWPLPRRPHRHSRLHRTPPKSVNATVSSSQRWDGWRITGEASQRTACKEQPVIVFPCLCPNHDVADGVTNLKTAAVYFTKWRVLIATGGHGKTQCAVQAQYLIGLFPSVKSSSALVPQAAVRAPGASVRRPTDAAAKSGA